MLNRFWQALEKVPGRTAVPAEWQRLLGKDYEAFKGLLRPTQKLAQSFPCTQPTDCGCCHAIVHHGPDDIVAVCRCDPIRCDAIPLRRADIILYELHVDGLAHTVADALGIECVVTSVGMVPSTWNIGTYCPTAGFRFPVYMTIQLQANGFQQAVANLAASVEEAFILIAPTRNFCHPSTEEVLRSQNALLLLLDELIGADANGRVVPLRTADDALRDFCAANLPEEKPTPAITYFPTPPGASWGDVEILFSDGETVSVRVGKARGLFHYTEMGMADGRNKTPTKQWELLRTFARENGILDWSSPSACRKNQKRRETLAKDLRAFFRIDDDPIRLTEDGKGWRTLFVVLPE